MYKYTYISTSARVPPRVHAEVGLKGMMVEKVDEMGRYCREGIDGSIDEEQHARGHSRPSISFHLFGQPVPCLDLKRDRPGYRTREGRWVCFLSIRWAIEASRKSRLASWIRLSLNRALLDPAIHRPFLLFSRLLVPRPLCLLFRRVEPGFVHCEGNFCRSSVHCDAS